MIFAGPAAAATSVDGAPSPRAFESPYRGTAVSWTNELSVVSLDKSHDFTYNPAYFMSFHLAPRWHAGRFVTLGMDVGLFTELTDSDFADEQGEAFFEDIALGARYDAEVPMAEWVALEAGVFATWIVPASKTSEYFGLLSTIGGGARAALVFPAVLAGLELGYEPALMKHFYEDESALHAGNPFDEAGVPESLKLTSAGYQSLVWSGAANPSWSLLTPLYLQIRFTADLAFRFGYTHTYVRLYDASDSPAGQGGLHDPLGPDPIRDTGHDAHAIYLQAFDYRLSWRLPGALAPFEAWLGALTAGNELGPDGGFRTPFFNRETLIRFGLSLDLARLEAALRRDRAGD